MQLRFVNVDVYGELPEVGMASDAGFTPTQRTTLYDIVTSYEIDLREKLKFQSLSPLTEK